jgi:alpha-glucuronidase
MWKEVLEFDTDPEGHGKKVKDLFTDAGTGMAGVGGPGEDKNWTGHYLAQANLYGYGRLAWDPDLTTEEITDEWVKQTFGTDPDVVETVTEIMHGTWPAVVDYSTGGIGLMHMMYNGSAYLENHYDPGPEEWPGYTGITEDGIGKDRNSKGNGYAQQYPDALAELYDDPESCPEDLLLFFHHLPWDYELADGRTVVQTLYDNLYAGVEETQRLRDEWRTLEGEIDDERWRHVAERFDEQVEHAGLWRDRLSEYFYDHAEIPDEQGRVRRDD